MGKLSIDQYHKIDSVLMFYLADLKAKKSIYEEQPRNDNTDLLIQLNDKDLAKVEEARAVLKDHGWDLEGELNK